MKERTQLTGTLPPQVFKIVNEICLNNGWTTSIPIKIGIEYFLEASNERRLAMLKKYNDRTARKL